MFFQGADEAANSGYRYFAVSTAKKIEPAKIHSKRELAVGGTAIIYRVFWDDASSTVEKRLLPKYEGKIVFENLQKSEFEILSSLSHPGIVKALQLKLEASVVCAETHVLVLEDVHGTALAELLSFVQSLGSEKRLSFGRCLAVQLRSAIRHMHANGIIHGDLAPENIMIDKSGQIRLIDFGLARRVEAKPHPRLQIGGRLYYKAPELQSSGDSSVEGDLYAAGKILEQVFGQSCTEVEQKWIQALIEERQFFADNLLETKIKGIPSVTTSVVERKKTQVLTSQSFYVRLLTSTPSQYLLLFLGLFVLLSFCPISKLRVNTLPFSVMTVNGQEFETPLQNLSLAAGSYKVDFRLPQVNGQHFSRQVRLRHGDRLKLFEDFRNADTLQK